MERLVKEWCVQALCEANEPVKIRRRQVSKSSDKSCDPAAAFLSNEYSAVRIVRRCGQDREQIAVDVGITTPEGPCRISDIDLDRFLAGQREAKRS